MTRHCFSNVLYSVSPVSETEHASLNRRDYTKTWPHSFRAQIAPHYLLRAAGAVERSKHSSDAGPRECSDGSWHAVRRTSLRMKPLYRKSHLETPELSYKMPQLPHVSLNFKRTNEPFARERQEPFLGAGTFAVKDFRRSLINPYPLSPDR